MFALERPGASGDQGVYADRIELDNIQPRFPMPDITAAYKRTQDWGYVRAAGQLRRIKWDDMLADQFELSGDATGWGLNFSGNLKLGSTSVIRAAFVVGEGIQNSMNDSPVDIGIENNFSNPVTPLVGTPLPMTGLSLFLDHAWSSKFTSAIGYSRQDIDNSNGQADTAFKAGQYALGNLLYSPVPAMMVGGELQWGRREMFRDPIQGDGFKLQFSFKYNFSLQARRLAVGSHHSCSGARSVKLVLTLTVTSAMWLANSAYGQTSGSQTPATPENTAENAAVQEQGAYQGQQLGRQARRREPRLQRLSRPTPRFRRHHRIRIVTGMAWSSGKRPTTRKCRSC